MRIEAIMAQSMASVQNLQRPPRAAFPIKNKADLFIAFGFGICKDTNGKETPGQSNEEIAKWIIKYNNSTNKRRKPMIVQEILTISLHRCPGI